MPEAGRKETAKTTGTLTLPVLSATCILLWFVPDILRNPPVFSFQTIAETSTPLGIFALAPPIAGALLLLLFAVRHPQRVIRGLSFFVGSVAAVAIALFGIPLLPSFPLPPWATALLAEAIVCIAAFFSARRNRLRLFYPLLVALPLFIEGFALFAAATGNLPEAYLSPHKLSAALFCTGAAASVSLRELLRQ